MKDFVVELVQARILIAIQEQGSFLKAAQMLRMQHTGVLKWMARLEQQTGLRLFDRSGYRTELTNQARALIPHCRKLLQIEDEIEKDCAHIRTGHELELKIVQDGILPVEPVVNALGQVNPKVKIQFLTEYHSGVEEKFLAVSAQLMIGVLPLLKVQLESRALPPLEVRLVARKQHPLFKFKTKFSADQLRDYPFITVHGSNPLLDLSTATLESESVIHMNNFYSKKVALLSGNGIGWMPTQMIQKELRSGQLREIHWSGSSVHLYRPRIYFQNWKALGSNARKIVESLSKSF